MTGLAKLQSLAKSTISNRASLLSLFNGQLAKYNHTPATAMSTIQAARHQPMKRMLEVTWEGQDLKDRVSVFPVTWLRESCLCSECYDPVSDMKKLHLINLDPNVQISQVTVTDSKDNIDVTWSNGHKSKFGTEWLLQHDFGIQGHQFIPSKNSPLRKKPKLWRSDYRDNIKRFNYREFMENDECLYNWLQAMEEDGLTFLTGAEIDTEEKVIEGIGNRVGFLKTTHYGHTFRVEVKERPSNLAYTNATLSLHCDLPFLDYIPGVQLLGFIKQPAMRGGENTFVDTFRAAEDLREADPKAFELLTKQPIDFHDKGTDFIKFHMYHRRPTIKVNDSGEIQSVSFNDQARSDICTIPTESVQAVYEALIKLCKLFSDPKNVVEFKMNPGDVIACDNYRVFHGRNGYQLVENEEQSRVLVGGYIDWDEMLSRRRVLQHELKL